MLNNRHTLEHVINKNFDKEHFSGICVQEFYETTLLNDLLDYYHQFSIIAEPLVEFFEYRKVFPFHILTNNRQKYSKFPDNFKPFETIIHKLYRHIESFIENFNYKCLDSVDQDLVDMFLKTMFLEYIEYIVCYSETIHHIHNVRLTLRQFDRIVNRFNKNFNFRVSFERNLSDGTYEVIKFNHTLNIKAGLYDFPLRIIYRDDDNKNRYIKFLKDDFIELL